MVQNLQAIQIDEEYCWRKFIKDHDHTMKTVLFRGKECRIIVPMLYDYHMRNKGKFTHVHTPEAQKCLNYAEYCIQRRHNDYNYIVTLSDAIAEHNTIEDDKMQLVDKC